MIYFASVFKLTENYSVLNYYGLYRVRLTVAINKSGFVQPDIGAQNWQY